MTVYSVLWRIFRKNAGIILMYIGIFTGVSFLMINSMEEQKIGIFESEKVTICVIDRDESAVSRALTEHLETQAKFKKLDDTEEALADAIFARIVEYILIIPEGYEESFLQGEALPLEKVQAPGSYSGIYLDSMVNAYLDTLHIIQTQAPQLSVEDMIALTQQNASQEAAVSFAEAEEKTGLDKMGNCYNYACYGIMAAVILGMGCLICGFLESNISRRNAVSPMSTMQIYRKITIGSIVFVCGIWLITEAASIVLLGKRVFSIKGLLMSVNMFVMTLVVMAMGFFISIVLKREEARSAVTNVVTLSLSFISGIFVPAELLGKGVLTAATFTPTYWYVRFNNEISKAADINTELLKKCISYMGIQLLFFLAFLALGMVAAKKKILSEA